MNIVRTVSSGATRPAGGLQHQPTKAPVKAPPPRVSTGMTRKAAGETRDGWVQQEEQS